MTLHDHQVLQRGPDGSAHVTLGSGEVLTLPTGGPYDAGGAQGVLVGDLWVLAGQSNMEGVGSLVDTEPPSPFVHSFQSREQWAVAEEPLHWLGESPRLAHHALWGRDAVPDQPDPRDLGRTQGAGLGISFGKTRHARTEVPVGLLPSAHGGTSMAQWDPQRKGEGGGSLYGATLERVRANGGKVAGVLWYQGESDANPADLLLYPARMTALLEALRADFDQPDLPFYLVQLGPFAADPDPNTLAGWNGVREAQRLWAKTQAHTAMVSAIDLDLDDAIHIGTQGLRRLGRRLALAADGLPTPGLRRAAVQGDRVRVSFDGLRDGLRAAGRPAGFSLRFADGREWPRIYKTTLEGDTAVLHLAEPLPAEDLRLWYGWGLNPYCNITDAEDAAVPAFGPMPLSQD